MKKLITAFFMFLSVTSYAATTDKITNFLMGQISDIAHKQFVKVDSIVITSYTEATYSNYYLGTIIYTTLEAQKTPDCYSITLTFNKMGEYNDQGPWQKYACKANH